MIRYYLLWDIISYWLCSWLCSWLWLITSLIIIQHWLCHDISYCYLSLLLLVILSWVMLIGYGHHFSDIGPENPPRLREVRSRARRHERDESRGSRGGRGSGRIDTLCWWRNGVKPWWNIVKLVELQGETWWNIQELFIKRITKRMISVKASCCCLMWVCGIVC